MSEMSYQDYCLVRNVLDDMGTYCEWLEERRSEWAHELAMLCAAEDEEAREREPGDAGPLDAEKALFMTRDGDWRAYVSDYYEQVAA